MYRSALPAAERLSEPELAAAVRDRGGRARYLPELSDIVRAVADEAQGGDLVVVMSNGAFGGIHGRLLEALAASPGPAGEPRVASVPAGGAPREA